MVGWWLSDWSYGAPGRVDAEWEEQEAVKSAKWRGMSAVSRGSTNPGVMLNRLVLPLVGRGYADVVINAQTHEATD